MGNVFVCLLLRLLQVNEYNNSTSIILLSRTSSYIIAMCVFLAVAKWERSSQGLALDYRCLGCDSQCFGCQGVVMWTAAPDKCQSPPRANSWHAGELLAHGRRREVASRRVAWKRGYDLLGRTRQPRSATLAFRPGVTGGICASMWQSVTFEGWQKRKEKRTRSAVVKFKFKFNFNFINFNSNCLPTALEALHALHAQRCN